jgi:hypothetical protein
MTTEPSIYQRLEYDGGAERPTGFSCLTGCAVLLSSVVVLPLVYIVVDHLAPPENTESRRDMRDLFEQAGLGFASFLADVTVAQVLALSVAVFFVILTAGVMAQRKAFRALTKLPCRHCGAAPLPATMGAPLLLTCERCRVCWMVRYDTGSGGDGHSSHDHHHHPTF